MANEYLIPFGVDATKFFDGLTNMDKGTDKLTADVDQASKTMQKSFTDAANGGEKLNNTLKTTAQQAGTLGGQAQQAGKALGDALGGKNIPDDLGTKVKKFTDLTVNLTKAASQPIKFNIDSEKIAYFVNLLTEGADDLKILNEVIGYTKQTLAGLNPDSPEWAALNEQLQMSQTLLKQIGVDADTTGEKHESLRSKLKGLKADLSALEQAGKADTAQFRALSIEAGKLQDQIGDTSSRVRVLASDTKYLDAAVQAVQGLAGAFTAAQGAAALFGAENEEAQKVIQKVTGAMAILQGVQAVATALNKDSALSVLLFTNANKAATISTEALAGAEVAETVVTEGATVATNELTASLLANPITLILVAIAALVVALVAFTSGTSDAEKATQNLNHELERQDTLLKLDENGLKRRTSVLVAQAQAEGAIASNKAKTDADRARIAQQTSDKVSKIQTDAANQDLKIQEDVLAETRSLLNDRFTISNISVEDFKKLQDKELEQDQKVKDLRAQVTVQDLTNQKDAADKGLAARKAALEQSKAILEQELKFTQTLQSARIDAIKNAYDKERAQLNAQATDKIKQLQNEKSLSLAAEQTKQTAILQIKKTLGVQIASVDKKQRDELTALDLKAQEIRSQNQEDGLVKNVELIRLGYEQQKVQITEQYKDDEETRTKLIDALNEAQIRETQKAQVEYLKVLQENEELQVETASKFVPDLPGIEQDKQTAILEVKLKYAQKTLDMLIKQGKAETSTEVLNAKKAIAESAEAIKDANIAKLKALEENEELQVETAAKFLPDLPGIEEQKQVAILKVKLKYAQKALDLLKAQGKGENSTEVLNAQNTINDITKALGKAANAASKATPTVDFFKLLGLGDLTNEQRDAVTDAAKQSLDSITQITDFIVDQYQRQIDKKQEVIDQIDGSINDLEEQLDKEKDLQEEGYANNVGILEQQIDEKKKLRDDEIKQQEELQKKQQQVQKAQLVLDTEVQASNLITSATEIFKALSGIPFIGVPLAITTIALMTGAFVAAKVKAFQAVGQPQTMGEGGWVEGKPHAMGGKKYIANDGSGGVVELEGGEHVTRKSNATKYADLLEAINSDNLAGMGEEALRDMLGSMGIHLSSEAPKQVIKIVHERDQFKQAALMSEMPGSDIGSDVKNINENVAYLAQRERNRIERWEDDLYFYQKSGSKTLKIKK